MSGFQSQQRAARSRRRRAAESPLSRMGGLFPSAASPERLWANVLAGVDAAREVPPGRWLIDPRDAYDRGHRATRSRLFAARLFPRCYSADASGLDLPADLLAQLDPVFHLALHAGRQAFESGVTHGLDRRRVGVILGNIALPTERVSALARVLSGPYLRREDGGGERPRPIGSFTARIVMSLASSPECWRKALGLGGGSYTLDAACASSLYALKLAVDELRSGRADAMLAGGVSRPDCLYTQMGFSQLRALSPSGTLLARSTPAPMAWWSAKAPASSCSSVSKTLCATATAFWR